MPFFPNFESIALKEIEILNCCNKVHLHFDHWQLLENRQSLLSFFSHSVLENQVNCFE
jgi:hypothetical protein